MMFELFQPWAAFFFANGAPARHAFVFRRSAVEARTSGTLRRRSVCP
jgi:hypothetical protein